MLKPDALPEKLINADVREYHRLADFLFKQAMETDYGRDLAALSRQYRLTLTDILTLDNNPKYYGKMLRNLRKLKRHLKATMESCESKRDCASLARQYSQTIADIRNLTISVPVKKEESPLEQALRQAQALGVPTNDDDD